MNIEKRSSVVENHPKIAIGDEVIDKDGRIYVITKIDKKKGVSIGYRDGSGYGTIEWRDWDRRDYIKLDHPIEELEKIAFSEVQNLSGYEEESPSETPSDSTDIATRMPKEALQDLKAVAEAKAGHIELLKRIMERKQNQLANILHNYRTQVAKIQKVLDVIELYLGVHEEIIILREGEKCPITEPIHIRQQVLFMDEEFADTEDQGLDFKRLEDFDKWLIADSKNLDRLLPEKKGIVVLRVRRRDKEYYITNRVDRSHYFEMLPVLRAMKNLRLKELEWEKGFVENLCLRHKIKDDSIVWNAIEWWKNKVIWKRPIMKDDAKALRMITWKVKKELGITDDEDR